MLIYLFGCFFLFDIYYYVSVENEKYMVHE